MIDALLWITVFGIVVGGIACVVIGGVAVIRLIRHWSGHRSTPELPPAAESDPNKPSLSQDRHGERYACYIVADLDTGFDPPRVRYISNYSCPADQLTRAGGNDCKVNIAVGYGDTYAEAVKQVEYQIETYPWLKWAHRWLAEDRGHLSSTQLCGECGSLLPKDPLVHEARKALMLEEDPRAEAAKMKDAWLRTAADFDNFRKRTRKDTDAMLARIAELEAQQRESDATKAYALGYSRGHATGLAFKGRG